MAQYVEYIQEKELTGDDHVKSKWTSTGLIKINESLIESEKELFVSQDNTEFRFNRVTMASGAVHYLLKDRHVYGLTEDSECDDTDKRTASRWPNGE